MTKPGWSTNLHLMMYAPGDVRPEVRWMRPESNGGAASVTIAFNDTRLILSGPRDVLVELFEGLARAAAALAEPITVQTAPVSGRERLSAAPRIDCPLCPVTP